MDFKEACHRLRITPTLLGWLTRYAAKGDQRKLREKSPGDFDMTEVDAFDAHLRTAWPSKNVPTGIETELLVEACGHCGLCGDPCEKLQMAHIRRKDVEVQYYFQHPSNLISLCGSCHDRYDDLKLKTVSLQVIEAAKERLVSRKMEAIDRDVERAKAVREAVEAAKVELMAKFSLVTGTAPDNHVLWTAGAGDLLTAATRGIFGSPRVVQGINLTSPLDALATLSDSVSSSSHVTRAVLDGYAQEATGKAAVSPSEWEMINFIGGSPCQMSGQRCPGCRTGTMNVDESDSGVECNVCHLVIPAG